jgi:hypothetical protein
LLLPVLEPCANLVTFASSPFNDTYIAELRNVSETCGYNDYIAKALTFPPDGHFEDPIGIKENGNPTKDCEIFGSIFEEIFWINPCWASYDNLVGKTPANSMTGYISSWTGELRP